MVACTISNLADMLFIYQSQAHDSAGKTDQALTTHVHATLERGMIIPITRLTGTDKDDRLHPTFLHFLDQGNGDTNIVLLILLLLLLLLLVSTKVLPVQNRSLSNFAYTT